MQISPFHKKNGESDSNVLSVNVRLDVNLVLKSPKFPKNIKLVVNCRVLSGTIKHSTFRIKANAGTARLTSCSVLFKIKHLFGNSKEG